MRVVRPITILAIGWTIFVAYGWPGLMSMDSFDQLAEARAWFFTDSHPPAMAALWGIVDRIIPGPFGMLVVQSTAFLAGTYLLLRRALAPRSAAVASCLVLLFPPVLAPMVVIWKDCLMAGFFVLGTALLLDERRRVRIAGLVALWAGTAMRYNAPAATLPLVVLLFEWRSGLPWVRRYAIAAVAWIAITIAGFGINSLLTDRPMHYWASSIGIQDLVGTISFIDEPVADAELAPVLAPTGIHIDHDFQATIRARYRSAEFTQLLAGDTALWTMPIAGTTPAPEPQREAIARAWRTLLADHPTAFVRYRLDTFAEVLGMRRRFKGATVIRHRSQMPELLAKFGLSSGQAHWQDIAEQALLRMGKRTPVFRPRLYAILALFLLGIALRQRDVLALLLSGILLELTYLPFGQTPDFRYSHWLVTCTCISLVIVVARRARGGDIARVTI